METILKISARTEESAKKEARVTTGKRTETLPHHVVLGLSKVTDFIGMMLSPLQISPDEPKQPLAIQNRAQLRRPIQLLTELTRSSERLAGFWRGVSLRRNQCVSKRDLQIKLQFLARSAVGNAREKAKALLDLCYRLSHSPPCDRPPARLAPVLNCLLEQARLRGMP